MDRREFLKRAGKYAAILGIAGGAGAAIKYLGTTATPLNKLQMPSRFANQGFTLGEYTDKKTKKEILILAEDHEVENLRTLEAGFIDYAQKSWNVEALGLEGLYGAPSPTIEETVDREFAEYLGNLDKDVATREVLRESAFSKYVHQEALPCFGIEDKDLYFKGLVFHSFGYGIAMVNARLFRQRMRYEQIPEIERIERFFTDAKTKFDVPVPNGTLHELAGRRPAAPEVYQFLDKVTHVQIDERNKAFSANIANYLEHSPANRVLIVVGAGHVQHSKKRMNTQDYLPYTSRIIYAPGAPR